MGVAVTSALEGTCDIVHRSEKLRRRDQRDPTRPWFPTVLLALLAGCAGSGTLGPSDPLPDDDDTVIGGDDDDDSAVDDDIVDDDDSAVDDDDVVDDDDSAVGDDDDSAVGDDDDSACVDTDGDGACDEDDPCPLDVNDDSDGDGVCHSDDPCPADDPDDSDGDGVCDSDDPCPLDDPDDSGVCDSDDLCIGDDADGDGICDTPVVPTCASAWLECGDLVIANNADPDSVTEHDWYSCQGGGMTGPEMIYALEPTETVEYEITLTGLSADPEDVDAVDGDDGPQPVPEGHLQRHQLDLAEPRGRCQVSTETERSISSSPGP